MKNLLLLTSLFIFTNTMYSQTLELIGPPGGTVLNSQLAVHPASPNSVYTATWNGALYRSEDYGISVFPVETYFKDIHISDIALPHEKRNVVFIQAGFPLKSTNRGNNWFIIEETAFDAYFTFNPINSDIVYRVRKQNELWRSNDLGENWFFLNSFDFRIYSLSISPVDTSLMYLGAGDWYLYKSNDSGANWEKINNDHFAGGIVSDIQFNPVNKNSIYIHGGYIYKSENGGKTSELMLEARNINSFKLNPLDSLTLYAAIGDYAFAPEGEIVKTTDGGENWETIVNGIPGNLSTAHTIEMNPQNPEELYAGIGNLGVYKTTNGGDNWFLTNLAYSNVNDIYLDPDNPEIIMSGQYGYGVMRTTDRGDQWNHPRFNTAWENLNFKHFTYDPYNKDKIIGTVEDAYYISTDRGKSWDFGEYFEKVTVIEYHPEIEDMLFAGSYNSPTLEGGIDALYKSTDGGKTWMKKLDERADKIAIDGGNIYALSYGYPHTIFKSINYGDDWEPIFTVDSIDNVDVRFNTIKVSNNYPSSLYIGLNQRKPNVKLSSLVKIMEDGKNWIYIDSAMHELDNVVSISSILFDDNNPQRFYIGLYDFGQPLTNNFSNGGLYLTEDNGKSWKKIYDSEVNVIKADNQSPRNIYVGTKFGIKTFVDTFTVTSVKEIKSDGQPKDFVLLQNYPNPFNPSTIIKFNLPAVGTSRDLSLHVNLIIFDLLGREIKTLVNETKAPGAYEVEFDASGLPSGVYFYKLTAGSFSQTRKMVLLK